MMYRVFYRDSGYIDVEADSTEMARRNSGLSDDDINYIVLSDFLP